MKFFSVSHQPTNLNSKSKCVSSLDRQLVPQYQPINFGTKLFSSTTISEGKTKKKDDIAPIQQKNFNTSTTHAADGPNDYGYVDHDCRFDECKPTIAYAKSMPSNYSAMRHEQILQLCVEGDFGARREALTRNIMGVDGIEYDLAVKKLDEIWDFNHINMKLHHFPYGVGLAASIVGGAISFPLIFNKEVVMKFNDRFVTKYVPCPDDLGTMLDVAIWSWNWMGPIFGQVSFVLLVLQFARSQMVNMGIKPFGNKMKSIRANALIEKFPQYNSLFVEWFSEGDTLMSKRG